MATAVLSMDEIPLFLYNETTYRNLELSVDPHHLIIPEILNAY